MFLFFKRILFKGNDKLNSNREEGELKGEEEGRGGMGGEETKVHCRLVRAGTTSRSICRMQQY